MMRPELERSRPTIKLSKVDLPQPDGPTIVTNSPSAMSRSMESRATTRLAANLIFLADAFDGEQRHCGS